MDRKICVLSHVNRESVIPIFAAINRIMPQVFVLSSHEELARKGGGLLIDAQRELERQITPDKEPRHNWKPRRYFNG